MTVRFHAEVLRFTPTNHHVRDTLFLGAQRIGHGINLLSDPETMEAMRANKNLVEINLISNKLLGYTSNFDDHPFPLFYPEGVGNQRC